MNLGTPWDAETFTTGLPSIRPEIMAHQVGGLDLMGQQPNVNYHFPHFSLANRMRLGWIAPTWIKTFDFGQSSIGGPVTLQAIESLDRTGPPAGRHAGIEIRIRDGKNYYFEYRRTQAGHLGDQGLISAYGNSKLLVGTNTEPGALTGPARPDILLLPPDADGEGPILDTPGEDYEESDVTDPDRMHDFRIVLKQINPADENAVQVEVQYIAARRPELQIRPAPGRGNWKSPDIQLVGPLPLSPGTVVKSFPNKVVATVRNKGNLAAKKVRVQMSWSPFTTSPGSWQPLDDPAPQDVPAGATVKFEATWNVPAPPLQVNGIEVEHFCVKVDVIAYVDPLAAHSEIVVHNNWARVGSF